MSLLIKGMDMPKNCYYCRFNYDNLCHALRLSFSYIRENDNISCPLSGIPTSHGRLIDADRMLAVFKSACPKEYRGYLFEGIITTIENAPTIIEAEDGE